MRIITVLASVLLFSNLGFSQTHIYEHHKGTNYSINSTMGNSSELNLLSWDHPTCPGTYNTKHVSSELNHLATAGIDNVRVFGSLYGWLIDPVDFSSNLEEFATLCATKGIAITYVLWSSTHTVGPLLIPGAESPDQPLWQQLMDAHELYNEYPPDGWATGDEVREVGEPYQMVWHADPGNLWFNFRPVTWPQGFKDTCLDYVEAVATVCRDITDREGLVVSYDLFNEPEEVFKEPELDFDIPINVLYLIKASYLRIETGVYGTSSAIRDYTVGLTRLSAMEDNMEDLVVNSEVGLTYASIHSYVHPDLFGAELDQALAILAQNYENMPLVCSEFYDRRVDGAEGGMASYTFDLTSRGIMGQMWGWLSNNMMYAPEDDDPPEYFDGLRRPDTLSWQHYVYLIPTYPAWGTSDMADYIAAIMW